VFDGRPKPKSDDCFTYSEYAFVVFPNQSGDVTLEQDQSFGIGGVTLWVNISLEKMAAFTSALLAVRKSVLDDEMVPEVRVDTIEIYVSKGGNVCIVEGEGADPIVLEPYRIDALVSALHRASAAAGLD
jgi:hypothetical protein